MTTFGTARSVGLAAGCAMLLAVPIEAVDASAGGQKRAPSGRKQAQAPALGASENAAIRPLYNAVRDQDWAAANAALPAARAAAQSPAGRYLLGQLMLEIGRGQPDPSMQRQAVDAMIASGGAPAEILPQLLAAQTGFALQANDIATAESALDRLVALQPNDVERLTQLAAVKVRLNKRQEAFNLYRRIAQIGEAAGGQAPEQVYRQMLAIAYEGRMVGPAFELSRTLVTHYPSAGNWRSVLGVYRDLSGGPELDVDRLMRAAGALGSERDFYVYAQAASTAGLPGEAKAVLEEGFARNVFQSAAPQARELLAAVSAQVAEDRASLARAGTQALAAADGRAARRTGDAYYGYGQYAEAAELYRAALRKGGEDPGLVNLRLGAALARAGRRAEAEAALRAVAAGNNAELAILWRLWLASPHP